MRIKKKRKSNEFRRSTIGFYVFVSLLIVSIFVFSYIHSLEKIESHNGAYNFYLLTHPSENVSIKDLNIYFDFRNKNGNISFIINNAELEYLNQIKMHVPLNLMILEENISICKNIRNGTCLIKNEEYIYSNYSTKQYTRISLDNFVLPKDNKHLIFTFPFRNINITPIGTFSLFADTKQVIGRKTFEFNLGNYKVNFPYISEPKDISCDKSGSILKCEYPKNYYNEQVGSLSLKQSFIINAEYSGELKYYLELFGEILLASALSTLIFAIIDYFVVKTKL